jgi:hypothetical protein
VSLKKVHPLNVLLSQQNDEWFLHQLFAMLPGFGRLLTVNTGVLATANNSSAELHKPPFFCFKTACTTILLFSFIAPFKKITSYNKKLPGSFKPGSNISICLQRNK